MAPLPEGDRWRHLHLATRSTRSLGAVFLLLGGCASIPFFVDLRAGAGPRATPPIARSIAGLLFYLAPGAIYLLCSIFLARRTLWAVVTTMTVAAVQIVGLAAGMAFVLYGSLAGGRSFPLFILIPLVIMVAFILALAQLEYHLAKSLAAIRKQQAEAQRGFEPLPLMPAMLEQAPPPASSDDPSRGDPNALPPEGDPQRPLRLAIRLARTMGVILMALGFLSVVPYLLMTRGRGFANLPLFLLGPVLTYVLPGTVYVICSIFLARRQRWAAVTVLVVVTLHLAAAAYFIGLFVSHAPWRVAPLVWIPFGVMLIFILALATMAYHLMRSFKAIREPPPDAQRGFEPSPAARVLQPVIVPGHADDPATTR